MNTEILFNLVSIALIMLSGPIIIGLLSLSKGNI